MYDSSAPSFGCRQIVAVISVQRLFGAGQNGASKNGADKFGVGQNGADINMQFKYHNAMRTKYLPEFPCELFISFLWNNILYYSERFLKNPKK